MRQIPRFVSAAALVAAVVIGGPVRAAAQTPHKGPIVEGSFGYAGFVDAFAFGASVRKRIKPRVSIGPEFLIIRSRPVDHYVMFAPPYLDPGDSADGEVLIDSGPYRGYRYQESFGAAAIMVTATFDLTGRSFSRRRLVPYVIASGGFLFVAADTFGGLPLMGVLPAISGGVGVRIDFGRFNLGPEILIGPESPVRVGVVFGIR
jgi:hypothetical protein